ncbi:tetratricopeptide repeat protein [Alsobacter sp. SYSU M60028]|uniref:Tetratricopeptide repeat protein n=1 Tax=Alsobacter ponti TaxID=2962936 RepID=A0ABT1L8B2_9HYPH|nr:tetratricopeptide repeat protein [Alsobacter ponti]MCP8937737.1 tetratricopeptide repeat protein [Alsobacter ponti]
MDGLTAPDGVSDGPALERRLAAILALDVVGFSRLTGLDEEGTLAALKDHRRNLIDPTILAARGRIIKSTGDGLLAEFSSSVAAVRAAVVIQKGIVDRQQGRPADRLMALRIGVHVGDVVVDDADLLGDGVNIAARLEGIADPGGVTISEDVWRQVQGKVAVEFADAGEVRLKNILRPLRVFRLASAESPGPAASGPAAPAPAGLALPPRELPSLAVLPFQNMSGDPEQEYFADGLVEDILTTLSKLTGLRVIARNSSFVYKGRAVDVRDVGKQLDVRYVLEGSVRRAGGRVRITAQLIEARSGDHVWAERYDRPVDDLFAVQDEITLVLATELQVKLTEGEQARRHYTTAVNVEAWSLWMQGLSLYRAAVSKDNCSRALALWRQALALDPDAPALNAMVGFMHCADARFGWWEDRAVAIAQARSFTDKALRGDPENPDAHICLGMISMIEGDWPNAVAHARRAVAAAPGSADASALGSFLLACAGHPHESVPLIERAMQLSPTYPANYLGHLGNAYRLTGRFEEAIAAFKAFDARAAGFGLTDLAIAYQQTDRPDLARETARRLLSLRPCFTLAGWRATQFRRNQALLDAEVEALRLAGLS